MSFIDDTYFNEDISLTGQQLTNISSWITRYEEELLKKLLGYTLYTELIDDLDENDNPQTQKFIDLVGGKAFSFELNGYTISTKWEGLRNVTIKKSLIAYYVYYHYRNKTETYSTISGEKRNASENSISVNAVYNLVDAWNKMVEWYGFFPYEYFYTASEVMFLDNSNYSHINKMPSAYNYLLANLEDFEDWVFEPIEAKNILGI